MADINLTSCNHNSDNINYEYYITNEIISAKAHIDISTLGNCQVKCYL